VTRRALLGLAAAPLLPRWVGPAWAQSITPANAPQYFRVEAHPDKDRKGRDILWGYVYNERGRYWARVRLLVETLDTTGRPVASQIVYVDDEVPFAGRAYYEARLANPGPNVRVSIHSGDWIRTGGPGSGGGGM
jgi:hypothetical protein